MTSNDVPAGPIGQAQTAMQAAEAAARATLPRPAAPAPGTVRFTGDLRAFWRLLLRGAVLLAVTLGIYRFWLQTDIRRFLWSSTEVSGQSLEYNGTAVELLIGLLIAIALLLPINLALFVMTLGMGPVGEFAGLLGFPILFVLGQFAIYRARRYRLTRTVLRGVRFHQTGSAWRYAACATFWWILIVLTLGLAYPFAQANLERYKMRNTHYGNLTGRFDGSGFRLFLRGILMWFLTLTPFVLGALAAIGAIDWDRLNHLTSAGGSGDITQIEGLAVAGFSIGAGTAVSVGIAILLYPVFQAMTARWWLSGIRFGELSVESQLLKRRIFGSYLRFLWYAGLLSILVGVVGAAGFFLYGKVSGPGGTVTEIFGIVAAVGLYVVAMLGYSTLYQGTVRLTLWRHGVETLRIDGLHVLEQVQAAGEASSPVGEGLADALNVGGF